MSNPMRIPPNVVAFDLNWIPQAELRGNSRVSWQERSSLFAEIVGLGVIEARHYMNFTSQGVEWPMEGPLQIHIVASNPRAIDGDNLLYGYKAFIDGLAQAGLIKDDREITRWAIEVKKGQPNTELVLSKRPEDGD